MFIGTCLYCDAGFMRPSPDRTPAMEKYKCEDCGEWQWLKHSRIDPESYSLDMVEVNEETKSVKIINKEVK